MLVREVLRDCRLGTKFEIDEVADDTVTVYSATEGGNCRNPYLDRVVQLLYIRNNTLVIEVNVEDDEDHGTDMDLGRYDVEVANGYGYYDEDGWYHHLGSDCDD